ncbi:glycosyltransferase family 4 protein [Pontiellaceae bacterium B12219]|nr:glycosyltransferase family 4 protein [Pontiellaceae bacterium B12219]
MNKICVWMNIPSHYQSAFYSALAARDDVDLKVVYLNGASADRAAEGWKNEHDTQDFECFAEPNGPPEVWLEMVPDWRERIHLCCGYFSIDLLDYFSRNNAQWCHWSEMPGIRLAELLGFRMLLFRFLNPLMLMAKHSEGRRIKEFALGAFGQGVLADRAFQKMGVPAEKIADLFYTPNGMKKAEPCGQILSFAKGRKIFLAVGALCPRKGIDILLKAYARLKTNDWCLVLCGLDKSDGLYENLVKKLGVQEQVLFLGAYPVERISEVYCAADVFVLASRFDGWGAVLNEAASLGLPMIGTDLCGGSWHVIDDGRTGFRVRADSVSSLRAAMKKYIEQPELTETQGNAARVHFEESFTPVRNAERLIKALTMWRAS